MAPFSRVFACNASTTQEAIICQISENSLSLSSSMGRTFEYHVNCERCFNELCEQGRADDNSLKLPARISANKSSQSSFVKSLFEVLNVISNDLYFVFFHILHFTIIGTECACQAIMGPRDIMPIILINK